MQTLYLITHCEACHSIEGKVGGWYDSELTPKGEQQALELSKQLRERVDLEELEVYSSDLKRAAQTAEILMQNTGITPLLDQRLREMSFGSHEGMPQDEHMQSMIPVNESGDRLDHRICPGAESRREVATRATEFMEEIMQSEKDKLIVTHGFAATLVISAFQKVDISSMGYVNYPFKPGSVTLLEVDDLFRNRSVRLIKS